MDLSGLDQFKASSLLNGAPAAGEGGAPGEMDLDLIDFDVAQPRRGLRAQDLAELAETIQAHGVLEPVSLRPNPDQPGRFIVNRGERRCRASRLAGKRTVPYFIDERVDRFAQAVENLQREDLSPFDLATFIAEREKEGLKRAEIARRLQKPASFITEVAGLVGAPDGVRTAFEAGRARDTRVLYQLTRALREDPAAVQPLLAGAGAITREAIDMALAPNAMPSASIGAHFSPQSVGNPKAEAAPARRESGKRLGNALLIEHDGRRGRLGWTKQPGKKTGEIQFDDDGSRKIVRLSELTVLEWIAR